MEQKITVEGGARTPAMIYESCKKCGKLISVDKDPFMNAVRRFYDVSELGITDRVVEITEANTGEIVSARYVPASIIKTLPPVNVPEFGNF